MKEKICYIMVIAALLAICVRGAVIQRRERAALVDERMRSQMEAIKNRARDFMEMNLRHPFVPAGEETTFLRRYELRIRVPAENVPEFLDWMKGSSLEPASVEGWPSYFGRHESFKTNELLFRVWYRDRPSDWN